MSSFEQIAAFEAGFFILHVENALVCGKRTEALFANILGYPFKKSVA